MTKPRLTLDQLNDALTFKEQLRDKMFAQVAEIATKEWHDDPRKLDRGEFVLLHAKVARSYEKDVERIRAKIAKQSGAHKNCKSCGGEFSAIDSRKKFCDSSCAAKFNNLGRKQSDETKRKISEKAKANPVGFAADKTLRGPGMPLGKRFPKRPLQAA